MAAAVVTSVWLAFTLNLLKDLAIYFGGKDSRFRNFLICCKKKYLVAKTPFPVFLKHYTNFIKEKNEIFEIMMSDYQNKVPDNPIFFFPALSQYWLLKKMLIQQYEKVLNVYLVDYDFDIFEDEIRKAKIEKTKDSLNKLIWKLQRIDPVFKEEFAKSEANTKFLEHLIKGKRDEFIPREDMDELEKHIDYDVAGFDQPQIAETILDYISNQNVFLNKDWGLFSKNKIQNIEKFELFTDAKIIKKYSKLLNVQTKATDSENLLRITKALDDTLTALLQKLDSSNQYLYDKFVKSEKKYAKVYSRLLMKKYLDIEHKPSLVALATSDAVIIINKAFEYYKEKEDLLKKASSSRRNKDKWEIAFRLWELNEIRKHICKTYLDIDTDFSKWISSFEKFTDLAKKAHVVPEQEVFNQAEKFLRNPINPSDIFESNNYLAEND